MRKSVFAFCFLAVSIIVFGEEASTFDKEMPIETHSDATGLEQPVDGADPGPGIRQPSFVENGGQLNRNEHAWLVYVDGALYPPPIMAGYRYGLLYWWDIGFDIGGNYDVFQFLLHSRMENFKTRNEAFFWALEYKTGYKYHKHYFTDTLAFDDQSWLLILENSFGFRFGRARNSVLYLNTQAYFDFDLHTPKRQMDFYLSPVVLGYEVMLNDTVNLFVEAGIGYSPTGTETEWGMMFVDDWFPVGKIGMAFRSGSRTARYR